MKTIFYSREADGMINVFLMGLADQGMEVQNMVVTKYKTRVERSGQDVNYFNGTMTVETAVIFVKQAS